MPKHEFDHVFYNNQSVIQQPLANDPRTTSLVKQKIGNRSFPAAPRSLQFQ